MHLNTAFVGYSSMIHHSKSDIQLHTPTLLTIWREFILSGLPLFESTQRGMAYRKCYLYFGEPSESFMHNQTKLILILVSVNPRWTVILFQVSNHLAYQNMPAVTRRQIIFADFSVLSINIAQHVECLLTHALHDTCMNILVFSLNSYFY